MQYLLHADFVRDFGFNEPNMPVFKNSILFQSFFLSMYVNFKNFRNLIKMLCDILLDTVTSRFHGCVMSYIYVPINCWVSLSKISINNKNSIIYHFHFFYGYLNTINASLFLLHIELG